MFAEVVSRIQTMSEIKIKLHNKTLVEIDIIKDIENGILNKDASNRFGVPKNTIVLYLELSLSRTNCLVPCEFEI